MTTPSILPRTSRAFASVLLFALAVLFVTTSASAQSPAFSAAELHDLKFGVSSTTVTPPAGSFSPQELHDLRTEASHLGTPVFTSANVFGITPAERADLRADWITRGTSIVAPVEAFTTRELRDLRALAHAQQIAGEPVEIAQR